MAKRGLEDDDISSDDVASRRRARISPRFRQRSGIAGASSAQPTTSAPSAFAGLATSYPKASTPTFTFPPSRSADTWGDGLGSASSAFGKSASCLPGLQSATPSSVAAQKDAKASEAAELGTGSAFSIFNGARPVTNSASSGTAIASTSSTVGGRESYNSVGHLTASTSTGAHDAIDISSAGMSRREEESFSTTMSQGGITSINTDVAKPSAPQSKDTTSIADSKGALVTSGPAFGTGSTAVQGVRLNKFFVKWLNFQIDENPSSSLEAGLRDYVAFARTIRDRVQYSSRTSTSAAGTAFTHPARPANAGVGDIVGTASAVGNANNILQRAEERTNQERPPHVRLHDSSAPAPAAASLFPSSPPKAAEKISASASASTSAAPASSTFGFGFRSAPTTAAAFSFGSGGPQLTAPSFGAPTAITGFQVPNGGPPTTSAPASLPGGEGLADEDDGMPKEDPAQLERAAGEEDEEVVYHVRAKLYRFKTNDKAWGDMGAGQLRLMKHNVSDKRRIVLRNDMGKVLLNVALYRNMKIKRFDREKAIKFVANTEDGATSFMIRVKSDDLEALHARVTSLLPTP